MDALNKIFSNNKIWSNNLKAESSDYFKNLSSGQSPEYLWIGCSDSRLPPNMITGLLLGELFVHRNVGNIINSEDNNSLSAITYAVDILNIKHIIVCGHYGCGAIKASLVDSKPGVLADWLKPIKSLAIKHKATLNCKKHLHEKENILSEINVIEQVHNVCQTLAVKNAWEHGQELYVHGFIYDLYNGVLKDLDITTAEHKT